MTENIHYLTQDEVDKFVVGLDKDKDGCISYVELEHKLDQVHKEIAPDAKAHNLHHSSKDDERHAFLRQMLGTEKSALPADDFKKIVKSWNIPSLERDKQGAKEDDNYLKNIPRGRRLRAQWEVHGPTYLFVGVVVALQIGFGVWQCVKYATGQQYQAALGWGVAFAKAAAGALYPTMFFLVLSMSRWFATFMRKWYYISRFINWDLSQSFHVKISIVALALATLHVIGHLSGSFVYGSRASREDGVAALLGPDAVPRSYADFIQSRPGWTGLTAIILFYSIALLSMPYIRKRSYQIFQLGHLQMFPMIGFLAAHGTLKLLQFPALGLVLAFPTLLVLAERLTRVLAGFHKIPAKLEILDGETVRITATMPKRRIWPYKAGQYIFLQAPPVSFFQWHPFTISTCTGRELQIHIKTDGDWTGKLRDHKDLSYVGIDGPFGAPAQRFYDFDQAIIIGSGIGVTPFSGILHDLQTREDHAWASRRESTSSNESKEKVQTERSVAGKTDIDLSMYRRVDFHWIVRDKVRDSLHLQLSNLYSEANSNTELPALVFRPAEPHLDRSPQSQPRHPYS